MPYLWLKRLGWCISVTNMFQNTKTPFSWGNRCDDWHSFRWKCFTGLSTGLKKFKPEYLVLIKETNKMKFHWASLFSVSSVYKVPPSATCTSKTSLNNLDLLDKLHKATAVHPFNGTSSSCLCNCGNLCVCDIHLLASWEKSSYLRLYYYCVYNFFLIHQQSVGTEASFSNSAVSQMRD